ncbi:MAG: alpha/beta hydrolase [Clostridia bacterium]|nr:alpha/beta hydrolase [Clostridia bacterium]
MDITLNYIEKGEGTPLILLHGNGESCEYFAHQTEYFSRAYRVLALDTRGHGKSPRGTAPFRIRTFADDLTAFMSEHNIEKAHVLGFSDGANIALCFALKYPEKVEKLVLNGGNLFSAGVKPSVQLPIIFRYRLAALFAGKSEAAKKNAEMLALMVNDPNIAPEELHKITAPTLVIAGTRDMIKECHTRLIYESLPNAELAIIEGDHFVAAKNPEVFNRAVERFLAE